MCVKYASQLLRLSTVTCVPAPLIVMSLVSLSQSTVPSGPPPTHTHVHTLYMQKLSLTTTADEIQRFISS